MLPSTGAQDVPRTCDVAPCETTVEMTVTPTGSWGDDGFLDDQDEIATYAVSVRVHFERSFCATENDILFQMLTTEFARGNITPSRHTVEIPVNGGDVEVESKLDMLLVRGTPPLSVEGIILKVIVQDCGLNGAQARAEANTTVAVLSEIRPRVDVEFEQPDLLVGDFRFKVLNTGNANLVVEALVRQEDGAPVADATLPAPTRVDVGDLTQFAVGLTTQPPGNYSVVFTGRWAGDPANTSLPRAEYVQPVTILAPPPAPTPEDSPTPTLAALAGAMAAAVVLRRRILF